jgi:hypothetical protein
MLCLSFRAVGTKFSDGDRLPRLTGCPLKFSNIRLGLTPARKIANHPPKGTTETRCAQVQGLSDRANGVEVLDPTHGLEDAEMFLTSRDLAYPCPSLPICFRKYILK